MNTNNSEKSPSAHMYRLLKPLQPRAGEFGITSKGVKCQTISRRCTAKWRVFTHPARFAPAIARSQERVAAAREFRSTDRADGLHLVPSRFLRYPLHGAESEGDISGTGTPLSHPASPRASGVLDRAPRSDRILNRAKGVSLDKSALLELMLAGWRAEKRYSVSCCSDSTTVCIRRCAFLFESHRRRGPSCCCPPA